MKATFLRNALFIMGGTLAGITMERYQPGGALAWWFFALGAAGALFAAFTVPD